MVIGRDGRLSSPELSERLSIGLRKGGCDVVDVGMVPTPVLYYATHKLQTGTGIMVTGSHIPDDRNGIKFNRPEGEVLKADEAGIREQLIQIPLGIFDAEGWCASPQELFSLQRAAI